MNMKEIKPTRVIGGVLAIFDDIEPEKELPKEQVAEPIEEK